MSNTPPAREQLLQDVARLQARIRELEDARRGLDNCRDRDHCLAAVLDQLTVGVLVVRRADGQVLMGNRRLEEILGRPVADLALPSARADGLAALAEALGGQGTPDQDIVFTRPDGRRATVRVSVAPVPGPAGRPQAVVATVHDVTGDRRREEELRQAADRNQAIAELTSDYAFVTTVRDDGAVVMEWATPSFTRLTGYTVEEWEATGGWLAHTPPDDRARAVAGFRDFLEGGDRTEGEHRLITRDGRELWIHYHARAVRDPETGRLVKLLGSVEDVTGRKEAERRSVHILESTTDAFFALDGDWRFSYVNRRAEATLRRRKEELLGREVWEAFPEAVGSTFERHYREAVRTGEPTHFEEYYGPLEAWFEVHAYPVTEGLAIYFRDITQRKRHEEQIRQYNRQLQHLARRQQEVQELERRHIARELHDEIGQLLTALNLNIDMARKALPDPGLGISLDRAHRLVQSLVGRVRDMSLRLRPNMLDDLGLVPALLWQFERFTAQFKIRVDFEQHGMGERFSQDVETAIYRIIQEALTNVARYAGVDHASVRLWADAEVVGAEIEDAGQGFDPDTGERGRTGGLPGMRERAALLGGHLDIVSRPGAGTRVFVQLPLREETEATDEEHHGHPGG